MEHLLRRHREKAGSRLRLVGVAGYKGGPDAAGIVETPWNRARASSPRFSVKRPRMLARASPIRAHRRHRAHAVELTIDRSCGPGFLRRTRHDPHSPSHSLRDAPLAVSSRPPSERPSCRRPVSQLPLTNRRQTDEVRPLRQYLARHRRVTRSGAMIRKLKVGTTVSRRRIPNGKRRNLVKPF
jgi:hypothetical protein